MYWSNTLIGLLKPVPLTEPQQFEERPADKDVTTFLSHEFAATGLGGCPAILTDNGTVVTAAPGGIPLWSVWFDLLVPLVLCVAIISLECSLSGRPGLTIFLLPLVYWQAMFSSLSLAKGLNKRARAGVVRATLDRRQSTLPLHDYDETLDQAHVDRIVFVKGRQLFEAGETSLPGLVGEISVIGRDASGSWTRWPVISSTNISRMRTFATHLCRTLGVPQQEVVI